MPSFLSNSDFLKFYDARLVGELLDDTGTPVAVGDIPTNDNLLAILERASGDVIVSCLNGGRYSEDDLAGLTGNSLAFLQGLVADIGIYHVVLRRGGNIDEYPQVERAFKILDSLRKGEMIFPLPDVIAAGHAASPDISIQTIQNNNYVQDNIRFFPVRRWTRSQL